MNSGKWTFSELMKKLDLSEDDRWRLKGTVKKHGFPTKKIAAKIFVELTPNQLKKLKKRFCSQINSRELSQKMYHGEDGLKVSPDLIVRCASKGEIPGEKDREWYFNLKDYRKIKNFFVARQQRLGQ